MIPKRSPNDPKMTSKPSENDPKWGPSDPKGAPKPPKVPFEASLRPLGSPFGTTLGASTAKVNFEGETSKLAKAFFKK